MLSEGDHLGVSGWAQCNQRVLKRKERGMSVAGDMRTEAAVRVMQPEAKKCWLPLQAGGCKERVIPWGLQKELGLFSP